MRRGARWFRYYGGPRSKAVGAPVAPKRQRSLP